MYKKMAFIKELSSYMKWGGIVLLFCFYLELELLGPLIPLFSKFHIEPTTYSLIITILGMVIDKALRIFEKYKSKLLKGAELMERSNLKILKARAIEAGLANESELMMIDNVASKADVMHENLYGSPRSKVEYTSTESLFLCVNADRE